MTKQNSQSGKFMMIGLFQERNGVNPDAPSILDALNGLSEEMAEKVVTYVNSIESVFVFMGPAFDPLDREICIGGEALFSDGKWIWWKELGYLVKKYRIKLPQEFLNDVLNKKIVDLDYEEILKMSNSIFRTAEYAQNNPSACAEIPTICPELSNIMDFSQIWNYHNPKPASGH